MERELKLTAPDERALNAILLDHRIRRICVSDPETDPQLFRAIYYDSRDLVLEQARCGLRARQEGERLRAAMKMPGKIIDGLSERLELEADLEHWPTSFRDFPESELLVALSRHVDLDATMVERVHVSMERRILLLETAETKIELVADHGLIRGLKGEQALDEIELELKEGSVEPMLELGETIRSAFDLRYSEKTKLGIGLSLC